MVNMPLHVQQELQRLKLGKDRTVELIQQYKMAGDAETAVYLVEQYKQIDKKYRILRSEYDVLFFAYEYFSEERNPENENNLIPKGGFFEEAPAFHKELCGKLD